MEKMHMHLTAYKKSGFVRPAQLVDPIFYKRSGAYALWKKYLETGEAPSGN